MSKGTTHRTVRIDDELWAAAQELAAEDDRSVSEVIRELLDLWVRDRPRPMS